jgi:O-antigen/teichoic acid export membrane protein
VGSYILIPQRNERWLVLAFVVGNLFNVALIVLLTKSLGGVGVSTARVAGECLTALMLAYLTMRARSSSKFI